jgi:hypothetical protein
MLAMTPSLIQRARAVVLGVPTEAPTIRLRESGWWPVDTLETLSNSSITRIVLPLESPATDEIAIRYAEVKLRTADGREMTAAGDRLFGSADRLWLDLSMPRTIYEAIKDTRVSLHLVVEIETYRARDTGPIPLDFSYAIVDGRAQCGIMVRMTRGPSPIMCRTAFGSARWFLDVFSREGIPMQSPGLRFMINPIATLWPSTFPSPSAEPLTSVTTVVRDRLRYERQEVTIDDIRLADYGPE